MGASVAIVGSWLAGDAVTAAGVASVAGAVAEAGAALAVTGVVTGSKTLQNIGGTMAVAGGVTDLGAMAVNAFDAAPAVADATQGTAATTTDTAASSGSAMPVNDSFTGAAPASQGIIGQTVVDPTALTADPASTLSTMPTTQVPGVTPAVPGAGPVTTGGIPFDNPALPTGSGTLPASMSSTDVANYNNALQEGLKSGDITTWFKSLDPATKAIVTSGLVQTGGAALGGLSSAFTAQEQLQLAQLKNSQDFQKYATAMGNLNSAPTQSFTGTPVGQPAQPQNLLTGQAPGLINSKLLGG